MAVNPVSNIRTRLHTVGYRGTWLYYIGIQQPPVSRTGTVTYLNEDHRYYMVEFDGGGRECYGIEDKGF